MSKLNLREKNKIKLPVFFFFLKDGLHSNDEDRNNHGINHGSKGDESANDDDDGEGGADTNGNDVVEEGEGWFHSWHGVRAVLVPLGGVNGKQKPSLGSL